MQKARLRRALAQIVPAWGHLAKNASDGWFPASIQFIKSSVSTWRWLFISSPKVQYRLVVALT